MSAAITRTDLDDAIALVRCELQRQQTQIAELQRAVIGLQAGARRRATHDLVRAAENDDG